MMGCIVGPLRPRISPIAIVEMGPFSTSRSSIPEDFPDNVLACSIYRRLPPSSIYVLCLSVCNAVKPLHHQMFCTEHQSPADSASEIRLEQEAWDRFKEHSAGCPHEVYIHLLDNQNLSREQDPVVQQTWRHGPPRDPQSIENLVQSAQVEFLFDTAFNVMT